MDARYRNRNKLTFFISSNFLSLPQHALPQTPTNGQAGGLILGKHCLKINREKREALRRTCTSRCRSGSSAMPPPASAPPPLCLYLVGVCTRGKRKTSRAPARTKRPTQTASPGSIAPTSFPPPSLSPSHGFKTTGACTKVGSVQSCSLRPP